MFGEISTTVSNFVSVRMMSQQIQAANSSPADLPMKRKRGRPRKDESLLQGENTNATPGLDTSKKNKPSASTCEKVEDDMVGQVVSGVIEGSFDAGYLLNVKVGGTDTQLRGVVFLPGRFVPVTPANDVAPHVTMCQRKEIPIPAPGSTPHSRSSKNLSVELSTPSFSPAETASGKQVPPADNLPSNETCPSFVEVAAQQPTSESGLEISFPEQNSKQAAEFDNGALIPKNHVPSYNLERDNPTSSEKQPASVMVSENLPNNDIFPPFEHKMMSTQSLESGIQFPAAEHAMTSFLGLKDHGPIFPGHQPAVPMTFDTQSASISLPLIDNFARNGRGSSLEGGAALQQISESGLQMPQPMEPKNQGVFANQEPSFEIQSSHPMELDNQPAFAAVTLPDNSSKNDTPSTSEGKPLPQHTSDSAFGISSTMQGYSRAMELNSNTPIHPEQISPFALQLGTYTPTLDKHPTSESDAVPQPETLPGNVTFPSWESQLVSQPTLEFGLELHPFEQGNKQQNLYLQSLPQMTQSKFDKAAEHDEVVQEFESSTLLKSPTFHVEATKDVELQPASEPSADKLPEIELQQQDANSDLKLNAFVQEEVKKPNIEVEAEDPGGGNDLGLRIGCEAAEDGKNLG